MLYSRGPGQLGIPILYGNLGRMPRVGQSMTQGSHPSRRAMPSGELEVQ